MDVMPNRIRLALTMLQGICRPKSPNPPPTRASQSLAKVLRSIMQNTYHRNPLVWLRLFWMIITWIVPNQVNDLGFTLGSNTFISDGLAGSALTSSSLSGNDLTTKSLASNALTANTLVGSALADKLVFAITSQLIRVCWILRLVWASRVWSLIVS